MKEKIRKILADTFRLAPEEIGDDASVDTIEAWDSLSNVHLVLALETEFAVRLKMEQISRITSYKNILSLLGEISEGRKEQ